VSLHAFAPAKVNLCLFLWSLRSDRRHELVTLMESLSLADELTLETIGDGPDTVICPGVDGPNLVGAALAALRLRGWRAPPVEITIDKRIPVAGGMGGGSSDAAATLRLAAELAPVPDGVLAEVAASLGSDVSGLFDPGAVLATGAGEVVESVIELAPHAFAILPQPFGLSTADVYAQADRMGLARSPDDLAGMRTALDDALSARAELPAPLLVNDLQGPALALAPKIEDALLAVSATGADRATVCGSGPTVAGVFWGPKARERGAAAVGILSGRWPGAVMAWPVSSSDLTGGGAHLRGRAQSAGR
jgi:4-diphosphocytidyl-2-C-methyl-D-erythritol kinase